MSSKDQRQKIKAHIRNKGNRDDFIITESFALYWWYRLNLIIFDGVLTPPSKLYIQNYKDCGGWCAPWRWNRKNRTVKIGLRRNFCDRKTFLTCLAHEMVHQWEWEILGRWAEVGCHSGHGKSFFSWKNKIKYRTGLPLDKFIDL